MEIDKLLKVSKLSIGFVSFTTGFVSGTQCPWDELHRSPEAVFNLLVNQEEWELAEWIMDNFI